MKQENSFDVQVSWMRAVAPVVLKSCDSWTMEDVDDCSSYKKVKIEGLRSFDGDCSHAIFFNRHGSICSCNWYDRDPREKTPLFEEILAASTVKKACDFVSKFGVLGPSPLIYPYPYYLFRKEREKICDLVSLAAGEGTEDEFQRHLCNTNLEVRLDGFLYPGDHSFGARFSVRNLMDFARYEIITGLAAGGSFEDCLFCGRLFGVGPQAGWRSKKAKFCCDSHKNLAAQERWRARNKSA